MLHVRYLLAFLFCGYKCLWPKSKCFEWIPSGTFLFRSVHCFRSSSSRCQCRSIRPFTSATVLVAVSFTRCSPRGSLQCNLFQECSFHMTRLNVTRLLQPLCKPFIKKLFKGLGFYFSSSHLYDPCCPFTSFLLLLEQTTVFMFYPRLC